MASVGLSRRQLIQSAGKVFLLYTVWPLTRAEASLTCATPDWRFCKNCHAMFYRGGTSVCTDGKPHVAQGYNFVLPCNQPETPTAQRKWGRCKYCAALFYNGYRSKGRCPASDAGHEADRVDYVLPHDVSGTPTAQTEWRFCNKCNEMFYDGYSPKGRCPGGGEHVAQGYGFVLPHTRPPRDVM